MGRQHTHNVPRGVAPAHRLVDHGVTCSLATNNVLNPFTPFGDCSLIRIANLYANTAQAGTESGLATCFDLVTTLPAKLMNLEGYGVAVGHSADIVVLDCASRTAAVTEIAPPILGMKHGRLSFSHALPVLNRP
jgi:cytosine deaminase